MAKKDFLLSLGERTGTPMDTDELLKSKISERKRKEIERQEELDEATHEAKLAEARKKTSSADAAVEKSGEKKEEPSGFKITGGMHVDLDEERKEAKAEAERLRKELADSASRTAQENNQIREQLHAAQMREIEATNAAAIASIRDKIDGRSPVEIIADIRAMAAELGLKPPDPGASDPSLSVRLLELQHTEAQREREFQWQMQRDRDAREDKKEEMADQRSFQSAQLAQQAKKDEMLANTPKIIGAAIGQALTEGGGGEAPAVSSRKAKQHYELQVPQGQEGTTHCEVCGTEVGVGPTAKTAVCANCNTKISIKRFQPESSAEPETEQPDEEE